MLLRKAIYTPIEQSEGNPRYNSDIYALGRIALRAIVGLSVEELAALKKTDLVIEGWLDRLLETSGGRSRIFRRLQRCF
ncbi:MAG: hypothetical protein HC941_24800 [Microcoleus sp. SU_5_3]|nr:hypothetical protein [Microcoleus sp. SU_5_3]